MTWDVLISGGRILASPGVDALPEQLVDIAELADAVARVHGGRAALRLVMEGGDLGVQILPAGRDEGDGLPPDVRQEIETWWPDGFGWWSDDVGRRVRWQTVRRPSGEPAAIQWSVIP